MTDSNEPIKILAPPAAANRISRRLFLGTAAGAAGTAMLSACGSDSSSTTDGAAAPAGAVEDKLNMYTWGEYNSPQVIKDFEAKDDLKMTLDSYNSNEQLIAKLTAAQGTAGYDIVVPTGPFIPAMVEQDLIEELDLSRITNFDNLEPQYKNQSWDPGNKHSICKDWGTTGYAYDTTKVDGPMSTWQDFLDVGMGQASGDFQVLDSPDNIVGLWLWANDISWMTTDTAQLDACEDFLLNELAPHVKAIISYVGSGEMQNGNFALVHAWNGDARQGIVESDPGIWKWVWPGPRTEIWMDNYVIPKGAEHPNAAYAWINYLLQPEVSLKELEYIGYNTGVKDIEPAAKDAGVERLDMVFFSPEQVAKMEPGVLNSAQNRRVEIANKFKSAAG
jgi:spermidine/putrescine transport system substrate-binding protein